MVRVHGTTTDKITAWRIRDLLACHPLLGGAAADIHVTAHYDEVVLVGWIADEGLSAAAARLARGTAGRRTVDLQLRIGRHAHLRNAALRRDAAR